MLDSHYFSCFYHRVFGNLFMAPVKVVAQFLAPALARRSRLAGHGSPVTARRSRLAGHGSPL